MTEPAKKDGLARSGFALNAWRLLDQYDELTGDMPPSHRYEATVTLSVLQFLLTNCYELYKYLGRRHARVLGPLYDFGDALVAEQDVEVLSAVPGESLNGRALIGHLRHAVSHPTVKVAERPTSGYTTVEDGSGLVNRLRFTNSEDVSAKGHLRHGVVGEPRVFTIELPLTRVTALARQVALVLAQPALENWDSPDLVHPLDAA